jgi:hypothetical protein
VPAAKGGTGAAFLAEAKGPAQPGGAVMTARREACFLVKQIWRAIAARLPNAEVGRLVVASWNGPVLSRADVALAQRLGERCRDLLRRRGLS